MKPRVFGLAIASILFVLTACTGGGGGSSSGTPAQAGPGGTNGGSEGVSAAQGDTILGPNGSMLFVPPGALGENTSISVGNGTNIAFPNGVSMAGPAIEASPAGLLFDTPAVIGVPVTTSGLPIGVEPSELRVYAREADGTVLSVPVIGYDDERKLLYARIQGFTTFQAAVPMFDFAIVPQTIRIGFLQAFYSESLSFRNNTGGVTWEVVSTMQTAGEPPEATEEATPPNEVAPGLTLSSTGTISGYASAYGSWAFTLRATDSANPEPNVAEVSHTITIASLEWHGVPGTPNADESILKYDDEGNGFVLIRDGAYLSLHKLPVDAPSGQNITSVNLGAGGGQPTLAVAPDGSGIVVAYEVVVAGSMDIYTNEMDSYILDGGDGMVNNVTLDLTGNGQGNLTVSFPCDMMNGFTGTDEEIFAFASAINTQLAMQASPARAVPNGVFSGVSIVDNGANLIGINGVNNLRFLPGGDAPFGGNAHFSAGGNSNNQRIYARAFDGDLAPMGQAFRVDSDYALPVPEEPAEGEDPEPVVIDPTLSNISRRAANPGLAFAMDRSPVPPPPTIPPVPPVPAPVPDPMAEPPQPLLFFVAYEMIRNLDAQGALRSDVYGAWFTANGQRVTAETRLDSTSLAGDSPGQATVVVANAAGAQVLWIDRGGDNAGTNEADGEGNPTNGTYGDLATSMIPTPTIILDPMAEGFGDPVVIEAPEPTFINTEATTTALHPIATVSRDNTIMAAWSERNDDALTIGADTLRKDVSLMVSDIGGGNTFMVDDAPLASLVFATSLAIREDGTIAVTWVEDFGGGLVDGFMRRFSAPGTPIENPIEISWNTTLNLEYLPDGRLSILARSGGSIARLRTEPEPEPAAPEAPAGG